MGYLVPTGSYGGYLVLTGSYRGYLVLTGSYGGYLRFLEMKLLFFFTLSYAKFILFGFWQNDNFYPVGVYDLLPWYRAVAETIYGPS